jgi:hypothetical protein
MIDATKSPLPTWKRYALLLLIAALVVAAGAMIWTKELHHSLPLVSKSKPAASAPAASTKSTGTTKTPAAPAKPVATTIPGGIPVSPRNPFAG